MLRQAGVGVALGSGSTVAKNVADIVVLERFAGAVNAMEGALQTHSNLMKAVTFWLATNVGEFLGHTVTIVAQMPKSFNCLSLLVSLMVASLGVLPLCWEPVDVDDAPLASKPKRASFSFRFGRCLLSLPM